MNYALKLYTTSALVHLLGISTKGSRDYKWNSVKSRERAGI